VAADALRQLGGPAVRAFPGTILPNPLIRELSVPARQAELGAPLVEELAAVGEVKRPGDRLPPLAK
jgi:hypothetical protein